MRRLRLPRQANAAVVLTGGPAAEQSLRSGRLELHRVASKWAQAFRRAYVASILIDASPVEIRHDYCQSTGERTFVDRGIAI